LRRPAHPPRAPGTAPAAGAPAPAALRDLRPAPDAFDNATALLEAEGATYAWLWANIRNLYHFWPCARALGGGLKFLVPRGWEPVGGARSAPGTYKLRQGRSGGALPFMAILRQQEAQPQPLVQAPAQLQQEPQLPLPLGLLNQLLPRRGRAGPAPAAGGSASGAAPAVGSSPAAAAAAVGSNGRRIISPSATPRGHIAIVLRGTDSTWEWETGAARGRAGRAVARRSCASPLLPLPTSY
jgi:hypothetical protein